MRLPDNSDVIDRPAPPERKGEAEGETFAIPALLRGNPADAIWKGVAESSEAAPTAPASAPFGYGAHMRRRRLIGGLFVALFGLMAAGVLVLMWAATSDEHGNAVQRHLAGRTAPAGLDPTKLTVADPTQLEKLSADDALAANEAIPLATGPNPPARQLVVSLIDGASYLRSSDCLTAAIYYEAASEPDDGMRAVAQVVLNRVRHKAYPKTVCGVVFQGSERRTGCQFSFTCDGSLARKPSQAGWARARRFAVQALGGYVYEPLGLATHYHADYVLPVWAKSLSKIAVIGRHIFYKWGGSYGAPAAFDTRYAGNEPDLMAKALSGTAGLDVAGLPIEGAEFAAITPAARPILDGQGQVLDGRVELMSSAQAGTKAAPGAGQGAPAVPVSPPQAAGNRWILGMPSTPAVSPKPQ